MCAPGREHRSWAQTNPITLFDAPVTTFVPDDKADVARNLKREALGAKVLVIWTDCDREGEAIGGEIVATVRTVVPDITVRRARFSGLVERDVRAAARALVALDQRQVDAVAARAEIDLRLGSAFTRLQTLTLRDRFQELAGKTISWGPCQFPTLGFVVDRYNYISVRARAGRVAPRVPHPRVVSHPALALTHCPPPPPPALGASAAGVWV